MEECNRSKDKGVAEQQLQQVRLLCPWARHLTGRPTFMSKTCDPEMATPKRVREWRINMENKKKLFRRAAHFQTKQVWDPVIFNFFQF